MELVGRYAGRRRVDAAARRSAKQAPKRVALEFVERERVTWDHRKLGGAY